MNEIKIICDSLSDIPDSYLEKYDIDMLPLYIYMNGEEYRDRVTISLDEFYKRIREEKIVPKTSQITYGDFYECFDKYTKQGKSILYISVASQATGTYERAIMAKNDIVGGNIRVIDSGTLCFAVGLLILKAAEFRELGMSLDQIVDEIEILKNNVYGTFSCDDLEYLSQGGRISSRRAVIGTVLGIKPLCVIKDGIVDNQGMARGKRNVAVKLVELAQENGVRDLSNQTVFLGTTDDFAERDRLEKEIIKTLKPKNIEYFRIGCGIGTHGGPGTTGFICFKSE
ncbi:DegV family protein [Peptostreptococcus equinus]|uniref:DegV family protein n=1 Tax=Peptostreptococcus equinus TaxID=3003601 RepID=A0ABY7JTX5_9FIRM|nr:DegV family protein [Peptostreptococcus sp. CBA3647]WAW15172.1 DegV family protein [Peptostreptococcus sp. CBA3647]